MIEFVFLIKPYLTLLLRSPEGEGAALQIFSNYLFFHFFIYSLINKSLLN